MLFWHLIVSSPKDFKLLELRALHLPWVGFPAVLSWVGGSVFLELWAPQCWFQFWNGVQRTLGGILPAHGLMASDDLSGEGAPDPDTQLAEQTACNVCLTVI